MRFFIDKITFSIFLLATKIEVKQQEKELEKRIMAAKKQGGKSVSFFESTDGMKLRAKTYEFDDL